MSRRPAKPVHPFNLEQAIERFQRDHIYNVLEATAWDLEAAATMLGIEPGGLKQKIDLYRCETSRFEKVIFKR